jgi:hypothetical protein
MKHRDQQQAPKDGSTRFHHIGEIEFWLTPLNRIFLIFQKRLVFPSLQGGSIVKFDDPTFLAPAGVAEFLHKVLRKQRDIRQGWPSPEEDEVAYAFS